MVLFYSLHFSEQYNVLYTAKCFIKRYSLTRYFFIGVNGIWSIRFCDIINIINYVILFLQCVILSWDKQIPASMQLDCLTSEQIGLDSVTQRTWVVSIASTVSLQGSESTIIVGI